MMSLHDCHNKYIQDYKHDNFIIIKIFFYLLMVQIFFQRQQNIPNLKSIHPPINQTNKTYLILSSFSIEYSIYIYIYIYNIMFML